MQTFITASLKTTNSLQRIKTFIHQFLKAHTTGALKITTKHLNLCPKQVYALTDLHKLDLLKDSSYLILSLTLSFFIKNPPIWLNNH
jgi:hypothetical protein